MNTDRSTKLRLCSDALIAVSVQVPIAGSLSGTVPLRNQEQRDALEVASCVASARVGGTNKAVDGVSKVTTEAATDKEKKLRNLRKVYNCAKAIPNLFSV